MVISREDCPVCFVMAFLLDYYISEFDRMVKETREYISDVRKDIFSGEARRNLHMAVDTFGDATKVIEEFQTDFLRRRIDDISNQRYLEVREKMCDLISALHEELFDLKKTVNSKTEERVGV